MTPVLTEIQREELIEKIQIGDEMERRINTQRIKYFIPTGKQEEVIREMGSNKHFIVIFSAANGPGKTCLLANILGNLIWGKQNKWFNYSIFEDFPYPKRIRIATTPKNLEEIGAIQTEIAKWWPKGQYKSRKKGKNYTSEYTANGWIMDLMSYAQEVEEYESATLGIMGFDEPPPKKILNATIARMRQGGIILIFMTPLDIGGEILGELEEKEVIEYEGKEIGKVKVIYGGVETACIEHGVRGYLKHENIIQMQSFYDEDEKEARIHGKPIHLIGKIYKDFEIDEPYVVDDFVIPDNWLRIQITDPHDAIPFAMTWVALDETNQLWIYDEFPYDDLEKIKNTNLTYIDYNRIIREKEARQKVVLRIIDPYFGNKKYANSGKTVKQELESFGLSYSDGSTEGIEAGHMKVKEALKYDKTYPVSSINHPRLHILKRCRNHWRSMHYYKRKFERSGEVKDGVVIEETYKHFCDNIRHLFMYYRLDYNSLQDKEYHSTAERNYMTA